MATNSSVGRDPDAIRREIEQTRASMSETVSALEARLNPQTLKQQAADTLRENTIGRVEDFADDASRTLKGASADVFDTIKKNPLPAALAALGLGWLFMESRNQSRNYPSGRDRYPRRYQVGPYDRPYGERYAGRYASDYGDAGDQYGYPNEGRYAQGMPSQSDRPMDRMRDVTGSVQEKAGQMADTVQDKAGQVASNVQDTAGQVMDTVQHTAGQVASQAQEQAYHVKSKFEDMLDENPLVVGVAAAALGAVLGFSIPPTAQENQLFGPARDKVMDKAQSTAQDTVDKVQQVAVKAGQAAKETAQNEAQKQNLTSS